MCLDAGGGGGGDFVALQSAAGSITAKRKKDRSSCYLLSELWRTKVLICDDKYQQYSVCLKVMCA